MELQRGQLIAQRYRLDHLLGEGGMGVVWAATHEVTRKTVALKFLSASAASDPQMRQRFLREARAACAVDHPNVVRIHDVIEDEGVPLMVMDLLTGESLGARLDREAKLPLSEAAQILLPVVSAVGTAHAAGVVHRDLKPDNIFLTRDADGSLHVTVLDFGIAKVTAVEGEAAQTGGLTTTGAMLGTPYYMSPEQVFGEKDIDQRADIWALGVILFECLSGQRPTQADNIGQILKIVTTGKIPSLADAAPDVPADIVDLVRRMLERDRDKRMSSLRELSAVLSRYTDAAVRSFGDPVAPRTSSPSLPRADMFAATLDAVAGRVTGSKELSTLTSTTRDAAAARRAPRRALVMGGLAVAAALGIAGVLLHYTGSRAPTQATTPVASTPTVEPVRSAVPSAAVVETSTATATTTTTSAPQPSAASSHRTATDHHPVTRASSQPTTTSTAPAQTGTQMGGVVDRPPF